MKTFFSDMRTQSKTAFSFGIRLIVLSGLKKASCFTNSVWGYYLSTLSSLMALSFCPAEVLLKKSRLEFDPKSDCSAGVCPFSLEGELHAKKVGPVVFCQKLSEKQKRFRLFFSKTFEEKEPNKLRLMQAGREVGGQR